MYCGAIIVSVVHTYVRKCKLSIASISELWNSKVALVYDFPPPSNVCIGLYLYGVKYFETATQAFMLNYGIRSYVDISLCFGSREKESSLCLHTYIYIHDLCLLFLELKSSFLYFTDITITQCL